MRGVSLDRILRHVGSKVRCWTIRDFPFAPSVLSFQLPLLKALVKMEERSSNFIREKEKQQVRESVQVKKDTQISHSNEECAIHSYTLVIASFSYSQETQRKEEKKFKHISR
mmetsp:Transcript_26265/g.59613  ORF Transcript_26265/g.59613 Transcript_26265/m.59613 type:complete len:112 (+) Transcript_26265:1464-1799(+)